MAIKLIAFDLDGTLLTSKKVVDEINCKKIIEAQEKGIIIVIASGRDKDSIEFVYKPLELELHGNNYVAGVNGQIIYSFKNKEYEVSRVFSYEDAYRVNKLGKKYNMEVLSCCGFDYYDFISTRLNIMKKIRSVFNGKPVDFGFSEGEKRFLRLKNEDVQITKDINKFVFVQSDKFFKKNLEKIKAELHDYDIFKCDPDWIEVMPKGVNKANAILRIAEENNITKDEIMAFGDAENDLEMFAAVKYGIAMGNGLDCLKEIAYEVCDDNDNQGIAKTLDKYVLNQ